MERCLAENPEIKAVLITSPTYDGVVSDVKAIAEIAHKYEIALIVDEAHGAHFQFSNYFPTSAVELGADLVIQSFHKTLPAMTQTAILHNCSGRVDGRIIRDLWESIRRAARLIFLWQVSMHVSIRWQQKVMKCSVNLQKCWNRHERGFRSADISVWQIRKRM